MIERINKITLYVNNQDEAKRFWVDKCKFMVREEKEVEGMKWLEVAPREDASAVFVLYDKKAVKAANPHLDTTHPSVILGTSNIEKTVKEMKENDIVTEEVANYPYGKMVAFFDQDENKYLLRQS